MRHQTPPSALVETSAILETLGPQPAIFLDFDGTLAPIVEDPAEAFVPVETHQVLERLAALVPVGIISGRGLDDVKSRVGLDNVFYSGSHGFEIQAGDGRHLGGPDVTGLASDLEQAAQLLEQGSSKLAGVLIETKPFAIAVHTRRAGSDSVRKAAGDLAREVAGQFEGLTLRDGKEIHEIRPATDWDKGSALTHLIEFLPDVRVPLFVGDDETDEDGFRAAVRHGGVGIVVGMPGIETAATHRLENTDEVCEFLIRLTARLS